MVFLRGIICSFKENHGKWPVNGDYLRYRGSNRCHKNLENLKNIKNSKIPSFSSIKLHLMLLPNGNCFYNLTKIRINQKIKKIDTFRG